MLILYLIIEDGYEGIGRLIFPTSDKSEAISKIIAIRKQILELQKRRIEVLERAGKDEKGEYLEDEFFQNAWDRLSFKKEDGTREITGEEWRMGAHGDPSAYCIQKWDGAKFECCCKELNVELT